MTLLELQRRMAEDVKRPLTVDFEMRTTTEDGVAVGALAAGYVRSSSRLSSFERLEIYNRQYWFRVTAAIGEDFPALNAVLGAVRFDAMVLAYLKENPSTSFTLRDLGAKLPAWLSDNSHFAGARHHLAVDIARLEWAYIDAFDKASLPPLSSEDLMKIGAGSTLMLQPHLQLLELRYPADEVVLQIRKGAPEADILSNAVSKRKSLSRIRLPRMKRSKLHLAVHRADDSVYYRRIDREEFLLLIALKNGASIQTAIGAAFAPSNPLAEQQAERIREYFAHASGLGWFCLSRGPNE